MWAIAVIDLKRWPVIRSNLYSLQQALCTSSTGLFCVIGFGVAGRNSKHLHINYILVMVCSSTLPLWAQDPLPECSSWLCCSFSALSCQHVLFASPARRVPSGYQQGNWGFSSPSPLRSHPRCIHPVPKFIQSQTGLG